MATDATGVATNPDGIPTYNTSVDAPSGLGFNAAMAAIQTALSNRLKAPAGIASGEVPVWNGASWDRSSVTRIGSSSLGSGGGGTGTKFLADDQTFKAVTNELAYVEFNADVSITATTEATSNTIVSSGAVTFDGSPVWIEFVTSAVIPASAAGSQVVFTLWDGATDLGFIAVVVNPAAASDAVPVSRRRKITPSAGSHTYTIRAFESLGTATVKANVGGIGTYLPGHIQIVKA